MLDNVERFLQQMVSQNAMSIVSGRVHQGSQNSQVGSPAPGDYGVAVDMNSFGPSGKDLALVLFVNCLCFCT